MRRLCSALLAVSLFAGCGGPEAGRFTESLERQEAPLTTTDVDVAPECQGLLTFANVASFATLDEYLPSGHGVLRQPQRPDPQQRGPDGAGEPGRTDRGAHVQGVLLQLRG